MPLSEKRVNPLNIALFSDWVEGMKQAPTQFQRGEYKRDVIHFLMSPYLRYQVYLMGCVSYFLKKIFLKEKKAVDFFHRIVFF